MAPQAQPMEQLSTRTARAASRQSPSMPGRFTNWFGLFHPSKEAQVLLG